MDPAGGPVQPDALNGGNPNLKPEKSKQFSLGVVLSPNKNFSVGLDWFNIKIDNMILKPGALGMVNAARAGNNLFYAGDVEFAPDGSVSVVDQRLRNIGTAKVQGLDLDARWNDTFSFGKLAVNLNGTYMSKYELDNAGIKENSVGTISNPDGTPVFIALNGGVVLRWKHTLSATWSTGPWSVTFGQNFAKSYRDVPDLDGNPHGVPDFATYDAQVAYAGIKNLKLTFRCAQPVRQGPADLHWRRQLFRRRLQPDAVRRTRPLRVPLGELQVLLNELDLRSRNAGASRRVFLCALVRQLRRQPNRPIQPDHLAVQHLRSRRCA